MGTTDRDVDQRSGGWLIALGLARTPGMTTTSTPNKSTANKTTVPKPNGSTPEHPDQADVASTSPEAANPAQPASPTKMVSISLPPSVHTKLKLLSSLTDRSISDIATDAVSSVIKAQLKDALAEVNLDEG